MANIDWDQVLIDASISAMQGLQEASKVSLFADAAPEFTAEWSVKMAKALVEELKKEIEDEKVN